VTPPCGGGQGIVSEDVVAEMPVLVSAPEVRLSPEARRGGVEGTVLVRCVITASGTVEGCEVLKGLPLADGAVLAALQGRHYRPAQIAGRAVSVRHNFTVKITQAR
jgi:TonB family protein